MSYFSKLLRALSLFVLGSIILATTANAQMAKVKKIVGTGATYTAASVNNGAPTPLTENLDLPTGAVVMTGANAEVYIEPVSGVVATVKKNTTLAIGALGNEPRLDLKSGTVVSQLDSTKLAGKNYGVQTPRGVAAARGTVYTCTVGTGANATDYRVEVTGLSGIVTITPLNGGAPITITPGGISFDGAPAVSAASLEQTGTPESLAQLAKVTQAAAVAATAVATVAGNPATFDGWTGTAAGELATTMQTIVQAVPQALATAVASASQASPTMAGPIVKAAIEAAAATDVANTARIVTQAAAQGAASAQTSAADAARVTGEVAQAAALAAATKSPGDAQTLAAVVSQAATQGGIQGATQAQITGAESVISAQASASTTAGITAAPGVTVSSTAIAQASNEGAATGATEAPQSTPTTTIDPTTNVSASR